MHKSVSSVAGCVDRETRERANARIASLDIAIKATIFCIVLSFSARSSVV